MAGMTRSNSPPVSVSLATLRIFANHYPERLHRCFFVDAPAVFGYLWAVSGGYDVNGGYMHQRCLATSGR